MTSSPSTDDKPSGKAPYAWDEASELHLHADGGGLLHRFKTIRRGTLVELIDFVMDLPESEQLLYSIQKGGDHRLEIGEIRALAARADFPGS